ncbi:MAG TPA: TonB family protein [Candidatus Angelobacter sp.]
MTRSKRIVILIFAVLATAAASLSDQPVRVESQEASQNLVKKIDPTLPQLAKQVGGIGGSVVLDATISPEGKVISVKAISGHPMLIQCVMDAVRQWEYKPFIRGGQPTAVVTRIEWVFPSPAHTKSEETALRDYYPAFQRCDRFLQEQRYIEAETKCSDAVKLADQLPPQRVLERSSSREFLANSLLDQRKISESIPIYEKALEIRGTTQGNDHDADFAWYNANLARAYFLAGQLDKADPLYARAVTVFQAAILALPDMKDRYTDGLKETLQEYAKLKDAKGEPDRAREFAQKAASLSK